MGDTGYVVLLAADAYDVPYKDSGSDSGQKVDGLVRVARFAVCVL